ncbi:hypothetical protein MFRU_002g04700 [Monilinia fructicola]|nr:hypothetical protein MFRU_002g04700 [Monilinia fructicola]
MRFQILATVPLLSLAIAQSSTDSPITSAATVPTASNTAISTPAPDIGAYSRDAQQDESALSLLSAQLATETNPGQQTQLNAQISHLTVQLAVLSSQAAYASSVATAGAANASVNALSYISSLSAIAATETNSAIKSQLSVQISQISSQASLQATTSSESARETASASVVTTTNSEGKTVTSTGSATAKGSGSGSASGTASSSSSSGGAVATRVPAIGAAIFGAVAYLL